MQTVAQDPNSKSQTQEEVGQKVDEIIAKYIPAETSSKLIKEQITQAIQGDKEKALFLLKKFHNDLFKILPTKLQDDEDILSSILEEKPEMFQNLPAAHKANPKLQGIVFRSMLEKKTSIFQLITTMQGIPEKKRKKLEKLLDEAITDKSYSFESTLDELYYKIYKDNKTLYSIVIGKGLLDSSSTGVNISKSFITFLTQRLGMRDEGGGPPEVEEILATIYSFLGINKADNTDSENFFRELIAGISLPKNKGEDGDIEAAEEETNREEVSSGEESLLSEYETIGPYSFSTYGSNSNVWDTAGNSVSLETRVLKNMSEKSIDNFMTFSRMMEGLGLSFLLEKHTRLIQVATEVNFYEGEGMSEARILKFFNSVGKNIGIPETSYEDSDGNKKVNCFNNLGTAKMHFLEVRDSGRIGDFYIDPSRRGDKTIVEHYMKHIGLLVEPFWEISVSSWNSSRGRLSETTLHAA